MFAIYKSTEKLAEIYHVDRHTITRYAKRIGVDMSTPQKISEEQEREIANQYYTETSTTLAEQYNVSPSRISQVWSKYNLKGKENRVYHLDNQYYFSEIDSQSKAYFLGWIGSDGCIYKSKTKNKQGILKLAIQKQDVKVLELLNNDLCSNKPIGFNKKYTWLEISSSQITIDLKKLGLDVRKTYDNTIANIEDKYMPALIRGYFEGDGSISYNEELSKVNIGIVGYGSNLKKLQTYLEKRNILTTITNDNRYDKYKPNNFNDNFGSLVFSNKLSKYCFLKLIYENCGDYYLDRKFNLALKYISSIENSLNIRDKQIVIYYNYAVQKVC